MRMKKNKIGFWAVWLGLVFLGFYTISKTIVFPKVFSNYSLTLNLLQRASGVLIFTLLFIQIILGAYPEKLSDKLGNWVYNVHAVQGPVIYLLVIVHPLFQLIFNYKLFHIFDPFYVYTQVCFLCKNKTELFYTFGRLAFWFLTLAIFWKKLYFLNYAAFFLFALHGWFVGSDFHTSPLIFFFWFAVAAVFLSAARQIRLRKEKGL